MCALREVSASRIPTLPKSGEEWGTQFFVCLKRGGAPAMAGGDIEGVPHIALRSAVNDIFKRRDVWGTRRKDGATNAMIYPRKDGPAPLPHPAPKPGARVGHPPEKE